MARDGIGFDDPEDSGGDGDEYEHFDRMEDDHLEHVTRHRPGHGHSDDSDDDDNEVPDPRKQHNPYGPDGDFAGLHPNTDPEAWEHHIKHMTEEARTRAIRMSTKAYEQRKADEAKALSRARQHAASAARLKRGIQTKDYKPNSERLVGWMAIPNSDDIEANLANIKAGLTESDEDNKLKQKVIQYEALRSKYIAQKGVMDSGELNSFRALNVELGFSPHHESNEQVESPRIVEKPSAEGRSSEDQLRKDIKTKVERDFGNLTPNIRAGSALLNTEDGHTHVELRTNDISLPAETHEDLIAKYGQEQLHTKRAKTSDTLTQEEGWLKEPTRTGWEATYRFNKEQYRRKLKSLKTGETNLTYGPLHLGSNKENIIKTRNWSIIPSSVSKPSSIPTNKTKNTFGTVAAQDVFTARLSQKHGIESRMDDQGNYYVKGMSITKTLDAAGVPVIPEDMGDGNWRFHTQEGVHLNPDQIAGLKEELHLAHGLEDFQVKKAAKFRRISARVQSGQKLPKDIKEADIVPGTFSRNIYSGRFGTQFGERDPVTKQLLPGQTDNIGMKAGRFAIQHRFKDDTDAIGWGTSWRPGNTEVSAAVLALPKAKRDRAIWNAAVEKVNNDGTVQFREDAPAHLRALTEKEFPQLETDAEKDEQVSMYRKHAKELAAAGFASTYYSTKKGLPQKIAAKTYAAATHVPGIGPKIKKYGWENSIEDLWKDYNWGVRKPLARKMDTARYRMANPLGDPNDPTMAGVFFEHNRLQGIRLPAWDNRSLFVKPWDKRGRRARREVKTLTGIAKTREEMQDWMAGSSRNPYRRIQIRSAIKDPQKSMSDHLIHRIEVMKSQLGAELGKDSVEMGGEKVKMDSQAGKIYTDFYVKPLHKELKELQSHIEANPDRYNHEGLQHAWDNYFARTGKLGIGHTALTAAKYGAIGAAVAGGGVLAVDRYQTYKHNKGEDIEHPILNTLVPERIMVPKVKVRKTMEYKIPHNSFTDALDLQGEKIPIAGRISVEREEKVRLRNHTDISGEKYKKNLPLLGGVGLGPAKTQGSALAGIVTSSSRSDLGPTKNMYVAGHKVPVDITIGRKERWDNKRHKLKASNDPYRTNQEDREHLVMLARQDPNEEARIRTFFHGDTKLEEMLDAPVEYNETTGQEKLQKKYPGWATKGTAGKDITTVEGTKGVGRSDQVSQTTEDYTRYKAQFDENRRKLKRERNARS